MTKFDKKNNPIPKSFRLEQYLIDQARKKLGLRSQSETVRFALKRVIENVD